MGYHVSILKTRASVQVPLDIDKLRSALEQESDLSLRDISADKVEIAPALGGSSFMPLYWQNGEIWISNPDENTLRAMIRIGELLGARVRGDEFETYITPEKTFIHPDDELLVAKKEEQLVSLKSRKRLRQWAVQGTIFGVFIILAWIIYLN